MNTTNSKPGNNRSVLINLKMFCLIAVLGLLGCGGGGGGGDGGGDTTPDQDASGLFKDGTASLDGGALMLSDLRGFVQDDRIIIFSASGHLLFDGQIATISSDDYTATVDVYEDGVLTQSDVAVTGIVTTQSQINGTISGTGNANGTFTLMFDALYSRAATAERIDTDAPLNGVPYDRFGGPVYSSMPGVGTNDFGVSALGGYLLTSFTSSRDQCGSDGTYNINDVNIYPMDEVISQLGINCNMPISPNYTGFASLIDGTVEDDTLLYAVTNGTNAQFAILVREPF
ncbi:MAG: hypothetical protein GY779_09395 [Gammaproteobacteria bacterium]|nr:hypothetical protein [Gammaproteobacteria bacterium]